MSQVESLAGKTALVYGTDAAPGRACADLLASRGVRVGRAGLADLKDPKSEPAWEALFQRWVAELGGVDIYVHCQPDHRGGPLCETPLSEFRATLYNTALPAWLGQKYAVLAMRGGGRGGAIVQVTSVLARAAVPERAASSAAHAGILMSSKAAALECAKANDQIVVNTVLAGPLAGEAPVPEGASAIAPDDIAEAVLFLVSDGAAYITGSELAVDGGYLSR